jgi:predicted HAD superfamily phosphohydrolase YqeG
MSRRFVGEGEYGFCPIARPTIVADRPGDVCPVQVYESCGVRAWMLDLDGTFLPARAEWVTTVDPVDDSFVKAILDHPELDAVIATNRDCGVIDWMAESALSSLPVFHAEGPLKPNPRFFGRIFRYFETMGIHPNQVGIMGDGLYHDISGANKLGIFSVLVARLDPHGYFANLTDKHNSL